MASAPELQPFSAQQKRRAKKNEGLVLSVWFLVACTGQARLAVSKQLFWFYDQNVTEVHFLLLPNPQHLHHAQIA